MSSSIERQGKNMPIQVPMQESPRSQWEVVSTLMENLSFGYASATGQAGESFTMNW